MYRAALGFELRDRNIPFLSEVPLPITYRGWRLPLGYRVDFICHDSVIVEVKAMAAIGGVEKAQALNYLRASQRQRALILNFGARSLEYQRVVYECARDFAEK